MKKFVLLILGLFVATELSAQGNIQSSEITEADQLSVQVVQLYQVGKYDKALPLAERAVLLREKNLGAESELVIGALRNLAEVQLALRKDKEAEATYERYVSIFGKVLGENSSSFIDVLDRYVCLLVRINRRDRAFEIQKRLYRLENKQEYEITAKVPVKNLEMGGLMKGKVLNMTKPEYPLEAKRSHISGSVIFKITVDEVGNISTVKTLCGPPILVKSAESSIRQAQMEATIVAGKSVKITGIIIYNFTLQ